MTRALIHIPFTLITNSSLQQPDYYAVAIGNGGHGYGTVKVPGAAQGISLSEHFKPVKYAMGQSAPWNNRGPNIVGRMDPDIVAVGWSATGDLPLNTRNNGTLHHYLGRYKFGNAHYCGITCSG